MPISIAIREGLSRLLGSLPVPELVALCADLPSLLEVIAGGGPLTRCAPNRPANVLQAGTAPKVVDVAGRAETRRADDHSRRARGLRVAPAVGLASTAPRADGGGKDRTTVLLCSRMNCAT
jgi:hypothetical protein